MRPGFAPVAKGYCIACRQLAAPCFVSMAWIVLPPQFRQSCAVRLTTLDSRGAGSVDACYPFEAVDHCCDASIMHNGAPHARTFAKINSNTGAPSCAILMSMNIAEIKSYLETVNLMHFSQEHRLPLRTLVRIRSGATIAPHQSTVDSVTRAIKLAQRRAEKQKASA